MSEKNSSASGASDDIRTEAGSASEKKAKVRKKRTAKYYALTFFVKVGITALAAAGILTFVGGVHICHDNNAYPSIRDGDLYVTYRLAAPEQGKLIVYQKDGNKKIGRVIAKGGDSVEIFNDYITVNDYGISDNAVYPTSPEGSAVSYPYTVPDDCVFVLNDHRSDISDSRTYGGIPLDDVEGSVVFVMRMRGI